MDTSFVTTLPGYLGTLLHAFFSILPDPSIHRITGPVDPHTFQPTLLLGANWFTWMATARTWLQGLWSRPFLALCLMTLPLVIVVWRRKAYPQKQMLAIAAIPVALSFAFLSKIDVTSLLLAFDLAFISVAAFDLQRIPKASLFQADRQCLRIASLHRNHDVTLTIVHRGSTTCNIVVRDDVPQEFFASRKAFRLSMKPQSRATLKYRLNPKRRGAYAMENVYLRLDSPWRLWHRFVTLPVSTSLHVYPDMKQMSRYALLAKSNRLSLVGVRRTRRVGQDHDFERLRDYTPDDNYRHMDWRATARRHKLTVRDFQSSQSQRVIFLVDCGRMMTNLASGLSLLDHSLNAMLMLGYVALNRGDSVGMIAFSDAVHSYVPPRGGMNQLNQLLHASFDRFPETVESRYDLAFRYLAAHCQKRALVVLLTAIVDEVNANQLQQYLRSISGRHLPLSVLLRDHRIFDAADTDSPQGSDLYRSAAAAEILTWRHQVISAMEHAGILSVDTFPEDMTAPLVNRYLEVKARHLL